jgi:hypothetical protein
MNDSMNGWAKIKAGSHYAGVGEVNKTTIN